MKAKYLWVPFLGIVSPALNVAALATTLPPNATSSPSLYSTYSPLPEEPYSNTALLHIQSGCVRLKFNVNKQGEPEDIEVWSHYPSGSLDSMAIEGLTQWRFHPRFEEGQPMEAKGLFVEFVYPVVLYHLLQQGHTLVDPQGHPDILLFKAGTSFADKGATRSLSSVNIVPSGESKSSGIRFPPEWRAEEATFVWMCTLPPMHGVDIVSRKSLSSAGVTVSTASSSDVNPVAYLHVALPSEASQGQVDIRFCIDPDGRIRDTVVRESSPKGLYDEAARQALEEVSFSPRKLDGKPVWTCGLTAPVSFAGTDVVEGSEVGEISGLQFQALSGRPPEPELKEDKPVKLSLSIPAGTKLPQIAEVELRFCIEEDGRVSNATIAVANPPKLFDRAALETVANWRFARPPAQMCDVYEWVRFPLSGD